MTGRLPASTAVLTTAGSAVLIAIVGLVGLGCARSGWTLVVSAAHSPAEYLAAPVGPDDTFALDYVHSVSNSPVTGVFRVTSRGMIEPVRTVFRSFGPGMPWMTGTDYERLEDGSIVVRHDEAPRAEINLWVSPLTQDRFTFKSHVLDLTADTEHAFLIEIRIRR
jgi:hypothetical protein